MSEPARIRSAEIPPGVGSSGTIAREDWIVSLGICVPPISVAYSHTAIAPLRNSPLHVPIRVASGNRGAEQPSAPWLGCFVLMARGVALLRPRHVPIRVATPRSPPGDRDRNRLRGNRGASASLCASFLEPNSGDFFPCRHFRVFPVCSACGRKPYRQGSPNTGRPGGMGPLPGCAAWIGPQGSTRPGRRAAGRAFPIAARSHAGDAPARFPRSPRLHAPLP